MVRIYFPRTIEELADYGFILLASVEMDFFTTRQASWMYRGIAEEGLGGMNTRSVHSMSSAWSGPWMDSILSDAFPNDVAAVINSVEYRTEVSAIGPLVVDDQEGVAPIVLPFRESIEGVVHVNGVLTVPRPGLIVYTWVKSGLVAGGGSMPGYTAHVC
jgi:hypothetical protein